MEKQKNVDLLPFMTTYIPESVRRKAEEELNETPENRILGLENLKLKLSEHEITRDVLFNDDFLTQFLRVSKFNVCKAFDRVCKYVTLSKKNTFALKCFSEDYFERNPWKNIFHVMPKRCPEGCVIYIIKVGNWDPEKLSVEDYKRFARLFLMQFLRDPVTQINGIKAIHDFTGITIKHYRICTPKNLIFLFYSVMQCIPVRWKGMHNIIRDSFAVKYFWPVARKLMPEKLKKRFFFHSNPEDLYEYFPPACLPKDYGGELDYWDHAEWLRTGNTEQGKSPYAACANFY